QLLEKGTKMARSLLTIVATLWCVALFAEEAHASTNGLGHFTRTVIKEPKYKATPKYSLMVLGSGGDVKVWMVEDGKRLFVDKNGNGDLTDDGPPIEPSNFRKFSHGWEFHYLLDAITPTNGSRHTRFELRRWNSG